MHFPKAPYLSNPASPCSLTQTLTTGPLSPYGHYVPSLVFGSKRQDGNISSADRGIPQLHDDKYEVSWGNIS